MGVEGCEDPHVPQHCAGPLALVMWQMQFHVVTTAWCGDQVGAGRLCIGEDR
jgi:hypothetical protein